MKSFDTAPAIEQVCYEFKLADYQRSKDRSLIDGLLNGLPPYTAEEVSRNSINVNVNFLGATRLAHEARMQFYGNFLKPGKFFTATTDMGPKHRRATRSMIVTKELAKLMKASSIYYETFRSKVALLVAHGIGPSGWDTDDFWCPDGLGICDVLIPANTLLTMKNLPFFAVYRSYTGPELARLTRDQDVAREAGWNLSLVDKALEYIDRESTALMGNNWPEVWSPEKMQERIKGDGGFYATDQVPTIDCFDFYFWDDDKKSEGWKRRIILDSWSTPQGNAQTLGWNSKLDWAKGQFLFNSKARKVADTWHNLVAFQFADLSAVAPFRYHSVRSLGYLLYAAINLQNRLRCKFTEAVFEALMMYFRVKSMDDAERALKVELIEKGFIDDTIQFVPANERFQVNANLVELGLMDFEKIIAENSSSYTTAGQQPKDKTQKTKFEVMAEMNRMQALISAAMQQAYRYQEYEYQEVFRRFCLPNSRDPDVNLFRARVQAQGVPDTMLVPEAWNIEPERVLGAGNKTLEMAIAEQLMMYRNLYDPEPQRQILRDFTFAVTDDPGRTEAMVPEQPQRVTDSVHDAQLAMGTLMMGLPVAFKTGMNHIEYVDVMLGELEQIIGKYQQTGMAPPDKIEGMVNVAQHISQHIQKVAEDRNEKGRVTAWQKKLTSLMNFVKAFAQRLQEMQQKQAEQGGNGQDAELQSKIKANLITAQAKAQNTRESHAQRTAQRQVQWEREQAMDAKARAADLKFKQQEHALEMQRKAQEAGLELSRKKAEHILDITAESQKQRMKSTEE